MNKKVIAAFSLIGYLLVSATLFSTKIQEEMTTLVKGAPRTSSRVTKRDMSINWRSAFMVFDEESQLYEDRLYEVREGTGGNQGLFLYELDGIGINPLEESATVTLNRDAILVQSASRFPGKGQRAQIVPEFTIGNDTYLYYYEKESPAENTWDLNRYIEVIGQSEHALLMAATEVESPFLPLTAKTWTVTTDLSTWVYSLTEAETFLRQLPGVAIVLGIFLTGLLFWLLGCGASHGENRRSWIWGNALAALASLIALWFALQAIDLPASLLPNTNVFDIAHYQEEFTLIFDSLRELGLSDHTLFTAATQAKAQCRQIFCLFALAGAGIITGEVLRNAVQNKREINRSR